MGSSSTARPYRIASGHRPICGARCGPSARAAPGSRLRRQTPVCGLLPPERRAEGQVLERVDRGAVLADQETQLVPVHGGADLVVGLDDVHRRPQPQRVHDARHDRPHPLGRLVRNRPRDRRQASESTSARTCAGPSEPSSCAYSKRTHSGVTPGKRGSSFFIAAHLASPSVSRPPPRRLGPRLWTGSTPAPRALLLLARDWGGGLADPSLPPGALEPVPLPYALPFRCRRPPPQPRRRAPACRAPVCRRHGVSWVERVRLGVQLLDASCWPIVHTLVVIQ